MKQDSFFHQIIILCLYNGCRTLQNMSRCPFVPRKEKEDRAVSPITWLWHTGTADLACLVSGGSTAKVGTETERVELSGARSEHMSFRRAKTHTKL